MINAQFVENKEIAVKVCLLLKFWQPHLMYIKTRISFHSV